jgi:uncharacterized damage-inducible protein DinB
MTSRELFIKTALAEQKAFANVLKAVNQKKWDHRPDPVTRTAKSLANQLAIQPMAIAQIVKTKKSEMGKMPEFKSVAAMVKALNAGFAELKKAMAKIKDKEWETTTITMKFPGGEWKDSLEMMSWGFLLDMIHHRGQLSTYLRSMGGKVPAIYGPSADSK